MAKIYLGKVRPGATEYLDGEAMYLEKHEWQCGWYWALGYIGNARTHCHFDGQFLKGNPLEANEVFITTNITNGEWWVIRDLFVQAYALRKAAEVYQYGGHQAPKKGLTDVIRNPDMAKTLNADLERVLDALWVYASEAIKPKAVKEAA